MRPYAHLTPFEREKLMSLHNNGKGISETARCLGRHKSTISRELKRNSFSGCCSSFVAQGTYRSRRKVCHPRRKLDDEETLKRVRELFYFRQWSPQQTAARLKEEKSPISISYATIYRGICSGAFVCTYLKSVASSVKRLRRRGKRRRRKTAGDHRGWHPFMFKLAQRPKIANERRRLGDWEADTVCGTIGKACRVTLVDRKSRMLLCRKAAAKTADCVAGTIIDMLKDLPHESITPDRGCEFCNFEQISAGLGGTKLYYPKPHQPWQRGTNENTNGLLREYFPKEKDVTDIPDDVIKMYVKRLNSRPHKCLHWKSPYEVFCSDSLRLG